MTVSPSQPPTAASEKWPRRAVGLWLIGCCLMVVAIAVIGAITRLTESGLSIVEWRPLIGALPPLSDAEWQRLFALYRETPEFRLNNFTMTLEGFRTIFWWEWVHRLWGRLIGVVFLVPFLWFWLRGQLPRWLVARLVGFLALGGLQAGVGWVMVASGLVDHPSVSHYRLALHLVLAIVIFALMLAQGLALLDPRVPAATPGPSGGPGPARRLRAATWTVLALTGVTVVWGAFVAGLDAGLAYNSFPLMGEHWLPPEAASLTPLWLNLVENTAAVQFLHRWLGVATALSLLGLWVWAEWAAVPDRARRVAGTLGLMGLIQVGLGITTLVLAVPVWLGVAHQIGALVIVTLLVGLLHTLKAPVAAAARDREGEMRASTRPTGRLGHTARTVAVAVVVAVGATVAARPVAAVPPDDPRLVAVPGTGISLPPGFSATVFADRLGRARHLAVRDSGEVYVRLRRPAGGGGVVALADDDGDGVADREKRFAPHGGTGIAVRGEELYVSTDRAVLRYRLRPGALVPGEAPRTIVGGFPDQHTHAAKPLAFDGAGGLYVAVGAPSNACQRRSRSLESPGMRPCPWLAAHAGVWRYDADRTGQRHPVDGRRHITGMRHAVAIAWEPAVDRLMVAMHGRDQLDTLWPAFFDAVDNARLPAEELHSVSARADLGWPYTYFDPGRDRRMVAPEYGGDGRMVAPAGRYADPLVAFPAHWAPNDLLIYRGSAGGFPARYHGAAFVAFHGSWNRAPLPQAGYAVVAVPRRNGVGSAWELFADGFAGTDRLASPHQARFRPMGLAEGPDGALYISDSIRGRVWRITAASS